METVIMVVGDSISQGSTGDWTWRYWLCRHLTEGGVAFDMVGPKHLLDDEATVQPGDEDDTYADPAFDQDDDAQWGRPLCAEKDVIETRVARYRPDMLLVLIGINDLIWLGLGPEQYEENLRAFITAARRATPGLKMVFGTLLENKRALEDPEFGRQVDDCNERLRAVAGAMTSPASPIVIAETAQEFRALEHTWDGTHPNPEGELRIAAAFADVLSTGFGLGTRYPRPYPDIAPVRKPLPH